MTSPAAKLKYSSTKILQQREHLERPREAHPRRRWREVTLSLSLSLQVSAAFPPVECITQLGLGRRLVRAGFLLKTGPFNSYRTRCQSDSFPVRSHSPLIEVVWGLLLQGSVGGSSGLLWVRTGPKDGCCNLCGPQVSVPGRSCSTFAWNMAGCRTWTWAPGGSRPQCSHLYTLQENKHETAWQIIQKHCKMSSKYQEYYHICQLLLLKVIF